MPVIKKDLKGKVFGELTVIGFHSLCKQGARWMCICSCGSPSIVVRNNLVTNRTLSCGAPIHFQTHGMSNSVEYTCWADMLQRCRNPESKLFQYYGGRGIKVCKRWFSFENFYTDMGPKPEGMSLERKDNNDGYNPHNCVWANAKTQSRNKRNSVKLVAFGRSQCLPDWAVEFNIHPGTLFSRINYYGFTLEQALLQRVK